VKVEEDLDMQEVEGEVNVKTERGIGSEEEECIGIKDEGMCSEEEEEEEDVDIYSEEEEKEMEDIVTKEEEDVDRKEEVSLEDTL
jgi:hypothetical protein